MFVLHEPLVVDLAFPHTGPHADTGLVALPPTFRVEIPFDAAFDEAFPGASGVYYLHRVRRRDSLREWDPWRWESLPDASGPLAVLAPHPFESMEVSSVFVNTEWRVHVGNSSTAWRGIRSSSEIMQEDNPWDPFTQQAPPDVDRTTYNAQCQLLESHIDALGAGIRSKVRLAYLQGDFLFVEVRGTDELVTVQMRRKVGFDDWVESDPIPLTQQPRRWFVIKGGADAVNILPDLQDTQEGTWYLVGRGEVDFEFPVFTSVQGLGWRCPWDPLTSLAFDLPLTATPGHPVPLPLSPVVSPTWA